MPYRYVYNPLSSLRCCPNCGGTYNVLSMVRDISGREAFQMCKCHVCNHTFRAYPNNNAPINVPLIEAPTPTPTQAPTPAQAH